MEGVGKVFDPHYNNFASLKLPSNYQEDASIVDLSILAKSKQSWFVNSFVDISYGESCRDNTL